MLQQRPTHIDAWEIEVVSSSSADEDAEIEYEEEPLVPSLPSASLFQPIAPDESFQKMFNKSEPAVPQQPTTWVYDVSVDFSNPLKSSRFRPVSEWPRVAKPGRAPPKRSDKSATSYVSSSAELDTVPSTSPTPPIVPTLGGGASPAAILCSPDNADLTNSLQHMIAAPNYALRYQTLKRSRRRRIALARRQFTSSSSSGTEPSPRIGVSSLSSSWNPPLVPSPSLSPGVWDTQSALTSQEMENETVSASGSGPQSYFEDDADRGLRRPSSLPLVDHHHARGHSLGFSSDDTMTLTEEDKKLMRLMRHLGLMVWPERDHRGGRRS